MGKATTTGRSASILRPILTGLMLAVCGALLLAACGGASPGRLEACSLVKKSEAEDVLGYPVAEPRATSLGDVGKSYISSCQYSTATPETLRMLTVMSEQSDPEFARTVFETAKGRSPNAQPVADLGDDAFWTSDPPQLHSLKKDVYVTIQTRFAEGEGALEEAKAVMKKALGRIP